jgi:hypothetical protein
MTPLPDRRSEAGFSLIELLLAMVVAVEVLIAAYMAFDVSNHAAAVQTQITDLQQSLRIVQHDMARLARMAGRGGLPADLRPDLEFDPSDLIPNLQGMAFEVRNNVTGTEPRRIARGVEASPLVLEGTDVLTVRGCFTNPLFQVNPENFDWDTDGDGTPNEAELTLLSASVVGIRQPLGPLCEELGTAGTHMMLLASPEGRNVYGLARVATNDCPPSGEPDAVFLELRLDTSSPLNPDQNGDPAVIDPRFPERMDAITACVLEEYRYYVQEVHEDPDDPSSPLRPVLARARFVPGTELPYAGDPQNYELPLADGVIDLQIALGFDSAFPSSSSATPGSIDDDTDFVNGTNDEVIYEAPDWDDRDEDDWLYNHPDDVDDDGLAPNPRWRVHEFPGRVGLPVQIYHLRFTTIARTNRADRLYEAPPFDPDPARDFVEDHDYDQAPASDFKTGDNVKHRRRSLTTAIDLRNL